MLSLPSTHRSGWRVLRALRFRALGLIRSTSRRAVGIEPQNDEALSAGTAGEGFVV